ncbi:MAG: hypothetical protein [Wendovervirus sonii]|uniref:Uncharacterized protein n=1 Tax=phage Lak_Megaphage_Sonny TaxID=3109229 RepID=A0ABZ0Z2C1_9CAUD|nr:MAG: hypothetical protein [phage Lak_Megaphage_Sonny]
MTFNEIIKGLENGSITVNFMGHNLYTPKTDDYFGKYEDFNLLKFLKSYKSDDNLDQIYLTMSSTLNDKHEKGEIPEKEYVDLIKYINTYNAYWCSIGGHTTTVPKTFQVGDCILMVPILCSIPFFTCTRCGKKVVPYLVSENEIRFCEYDDEKKSGRCIAEDMDIDTFIAEINVTEHLGLANYFNIRQIQKQYADKYYNINYPYYRNMRMQDMAKANIGYCQCDSGYCSIYLSKDKAKVIIAKHSSDDLDREYDYQGDIDFSVWAYYCTDTAQIKKYVKNYDKIYDEDPDEIGKDYIEVGVIPGRYRITHHDTCPDGNIWTIIEKVN